MSVKPVLALAFAILSGLYLLVMTPTLDPLPVLDEGLALMVFLNALAALGVDVRALFGRRTPAPVRVRSRDR
jgi:hypothetical protein